jgi:hypothetical protein
VTAESEGPGGRAIPVRRPEIDRFDRSSHEKRFFDALMEYCATSPDDPDFAAARDRLQSAGSEPPPVKPSIPDDPILRQIAEMWDLLERAMTAMSIVAISNEVTHEDDLTYYRAVLDLIRARFLDRNRPAHITPPPPTEVNTWIDPLFPGEDSK